MEECVKGGFGYIGSCDAMSSAVRNTISLCIMRVHVRRVTKKLGFEDYSSMRWNIFPVPRSFLKMGLSYSYCLDLRTQSTVTFRYVYKGIPWKSQYHWKAIGLQLPTAEVTLKILVFYLFEETLSSISWSVACCKDYSISFINYILFFCCWRLHIALLFWSKLLVYVPFVVKGEMWVPSGRQFLSL